MVVAGRALKVLRGSLYPQITAAAQDIAAAAQRDDRESHGDWISQHLATLNLLRDLLNEIGWRDKDPESDVTIDPAAYRTLLLAALRQQLETECDLAHTHNITQRESAIDNAMLIEHLIQEIAHGG